MQWSFAAAPGHPLLKSVLDAALPRVIAQDIDVDNDNFVHEITGPTIYTRGLANVLLQDVNLTNSTLAQIREQKDAEWRSTGVCILTWAELFERLKNGYSSQGNGFLDSPTWF